MIARLRAKRIPMRRSTHAPRPPARRRGSEVSAASAAMTATKETAFKRKQPVSPNAAMVSPAIIGPMTRERLNCIELSEIAFIRSSRPTRSRKSD